MVSNTGQSIHHWPLRLVAKKCGPASRISTCGRESRGQGKGRSHQRGQSVRVLSHYGEEDCDVIWFPTSHI